jgi:hypothetical protein
MESPIKSRPCQFERARLCRKVASFALKGNSFSRKVASFALKGNSLSRKVASFALKGLGFSRATNAARKCGL